MHWSSEIFRDTGEDRVIKENGSGSKRYCRFPSLNQIKRVEKVAPGATARRGARGSNTPVKSEINPELANA